MGKGKQIAAPVVFQGGGEQERRRGAGAFRDELGMDVVDEDGHLMGAFHGAAGRRGRVSRDAGEPGDGEAFDWTRCAQIEFVTREVKGPGSARTTREIIWCLPRREDHRLWGNRRGKGAVKAG